MNRNPAEMTGYASLYPGVDHHPNGADHPRWHAPAEHFHACTRCGQTVITCADPPICATCRAVDREPQGETVRLFTPAPNQIPGQLGFGT